MDSTTGTHTRENSHNIQSLKSSITVQKPNFFYSPVLTNPNPPQIPPKEDKAKLLSQYRQTFNGCLPPTAETMQDYLKTNSSGKRDEL